MLTSNLHVWLPCLDFFCLSLNPRVFGLGIINMSLVMVQIEVLAWLLGSLQTVHY